MTSQELDGIPALLQAGRAERARAIAEAAVRARPDDLSARLYRGMSLHALGSHEAALADLRETATRAEAAGDKQVIGTATYQMGVLHGERHHWPAALGAFERAARILGHDGQLCAGMCEALYRLGRRDEALLWGRRTIELRDREARCEPSEVVPRRRPRAFDPQAKARNVVAYSLFGSDPFYHECALTVARTTPISFPEFTARFYCATDVPATVRRALRAAEAQVLMVRRDGEGSVSPFSGLFWRFLPFDDPEVDVVLVRDVDSPVLPRERAAIDLWLAGDAPFYCLRDNPIHAEPILAGMWGGFTGVLPRLAPLVENYIVSDHSRFVDQRFLRRVVWPRIRGAALSVDSCYSIGTSVDYPAGSPKMGRLHVGCGWSRRQILGKG